MIGHREESSGSASDGGLSNLIIGYNAGQEMTGKFNTLIGWMAGKNMSNTSNNTVVGNSMVNVIGDSYDVSSNVVIGNSSLDTSSLIGNLTTNTLVGDSIMTDTTKGNGNVCIGKGILKKCKQAQQNVGIGTNTMGFALSNVSGNVVIGENSMYYASTGKSNVYIGRLVCRYNNGNSNVFIGNQTGTNWKDRTEAEEPDSSSKSKVAISNNISIGQFSMEKLGYTTLWGDESSLTAQEISDGHQHYHDFFNESLGESGLKSNIFFTSNFSTDSSGNHTVDGTNCEDNVFIGKESGRALRMSDDCVYIGNFSGFGMTRDNFVNTLEILDDKFDSNSASVNTLGNVKNNVCIGKMSGVTLVNGEENILIGTKSGLGIEEGSYNIYIGNRNIDNGTIESNFISPAAKNDVMVGYNVGGVSGGSNVVVGSESGKNLEKENIVIGFYTCNNSSNISSTISTSSDITTYTFNYLSYIYKTYVKTNNAAKFKTVLYQNNYYTGTFTQGIKLLNLDLNRDKFIIIGNTSEVVKAIDDTICIGNRISFDVSTPEQLFTSLYFKISDISIDNINIELTNYYTNKKTETGSNVDNLESDYLNWSFVSESPEIPFINSLGDDIFFTLDDTSSTTSIGGFAQFDNKRYKTGDVGYEHDFYKDKKCFALPFFNVNGQLLAASANKLYPDESKTFDRIKTIHGDTDNLSPVLNTIYTSHDYIFNRLLFKETDLVTPNITKIKEVPFALYSSVIENKVIGCINSKENSQLTNSSGDEYDIELFKRNVIVFQKFFDSYNLNSTYSLSRIDDCEMQIIAEDGNMGIFARNDLNVISKANIVIEQIDDSQPLNTNGLYLGGSLLELKQNITNDGVEPTKLSGVFLDNGEVSMYSTQTGAAGKVYWNAGLFIDELDTDNESCRLSLKTQTNDLNDTNRVFNKIELTNDCIRMIGSKILIANKVDNSIYIDNSIIRITGTGTASGGFTTFSFTGSHDCTYSDEIFDKTKLKELQTEEIEEIIESLRGKIVCSTGEIDNGSKQGKEAITIDHAVPKVEFSKQRYMKNVYGVISNIETDGVTKEHNAQFGIMRFIQNEETYKMKVNSIGEGGIWVSNSNGNIENGDYITTSDIEGIGMKQDDDLLHNYTVAKASIDCDFSLNSDKYNCKSVDNYKIAFIACTYHCG